MDAALKRICVFCGANTGLRPAFANAARELGSLMAARGIGLVYGGGNVGLMGVIADAMLDAGSEVIGVIPASLVAKEIAHRGVTELRIVQTMHERKALMSELSDAFIAMPGGFGTLDEFFEILTWSQLGFHDKPCGLLNVAGYYDGLLRMMDHAVVEGFLLPGNRKLVIADTDAARLLERLAGSA
ncbi:MAG TPA: TIGR00730 family Rossman fold protein [Burkholderiales bacterium]